ncbi:MAG: hypothetical protein JWM85_3619 [Acidimicrobiaceae bacterium]|nr:hypothetical protein [Acidimicrobiaceae bacterium]
MSSLSLQSLTTVSLASLWGKLRSALLPDADPVPQADIGLPPACLCPSLLPIGTPVVWNGEKAWIHSAELSYGPNCFYDIRLYSNGQLILGVWEGDLERQ